VNQAGDKQLLQQTNVLELDDDNTTEWGGGRNLVNNNNDNNNGENRDNDDKSIKNTNNISPKQIGD
jgi:hypothetical protein